MRTRLYLTAVVTSIVVAGLAVTAAFAGLLDDDDGTPSGWQVPTRPAEPLGSPPPPAPDAEPKLAEPAPPPEPRLNLAADVTVAADGFLSWAALDRETGDTAGSGNQTSTNTTESMIKVWLIADYLRRNEEPGPDQLADASRAIRNSDDGAAERLYVAGGRNDVVERMIDVCGLTDTEVYPFYWSRTEISARDSVRLGSCIADGTAAGPEWTDWLLEEMRQVEGTTNPEDQPAGGRWGIIDGLPEETLDQGVSIKNGWTAIGRTNSWHLNCLAITDQWVMAVLMRYPVEHGLDYGAGRCASVAEQLVTAPELPSAAR